MKFIRDIIQFIHLLLAMIGMAAVLFTALCLLAWVAPARADDQVLLGAWSVHLESHKGAPNESHELTGYQTGPFVFASFVNSYGAKSELMGIETPALSHGNLNLSLYVGGVRGYGHCGWVPYSHAGVEERDDKICGVVVPRLSYTRWKVITPSIVLFGSAATLYFTVPLEF
jgi:hypothetical protein